MSEMQKKQDIMEFERNRQQLINVSMQKQQFQMQLSALEAALAELKESSEEKVFKIIGPIMIEKNSKDMKKELEEAKESIDLRIKTLTKQEELLIKTLNKLKAKIEGKIEEEETKEKPKKK